MKATEQCFAVVLVIYAEQGFFFWYFINFYMNRIYSTI